VFPPDQQPPASFELNFLSRSVFFCLFLLVANPYLHKALHSSAWRVGMAVSLCRSVGVGCAPLQVEDFLYDRASGIHGLIRNTSGRRLQSAAVGFRLVDSRGHTLGMAWDRTTNLDADAVWRFRVAVVGHKVAWVALVDLRTDDNWFGNLFQAFVAGQSAGPGD
jgi:hypothetical protein